MSKISKNENINRERGEKLPSLLDIYIKENKIKFDINNKKFQMYCSLANRIQDKCNFLVFPKEKTVHKNDSWEVLDYIFKCDLCVRDWNFWEWLIKKEVILSQKNHLQKFDNIKQFIQLQEQKAVIKPMTKTEKEEFCECLRLWLLSWFETVFWIKTWYKIPRIWFRDWDIFIFNNWRLNLKDWTFKEEEYSLTQDSSISISYPYSEIEKLTLEECLTECINLEKYISSEDVISSITVWYLICWIFRNEFKELHNEFPFLWFEWYSWTGKTSLLNFLSWICWYDWNTINWVCDSEYAFEVWMDSLWNRYYFIDEIQKVSAKLLRYLQASFNSWENHKGWANWNRQDIMTLKKDCSIIWAWEILPPEEEALLNRFIICCPASPFAVKKNVRDVDEIAKYVELTGENTISDEYLNTSEIKKLAIFYYRPKFMRILRDKKSINFKDYHDKATEYIEKFSNEHIDTRHKNCLSAAITWYLIIHWNDIDENKLKEIITEYFNRLKAYRKHSIVSGKIVEYIINNISEFWSRTWKIKWTNQKWPMLYLKYSDNDKWIIMQIPNIIKYCKDKIEAKLPAKHIEQQFRQLIWCDKDNQDYKAAKVAKWTRNLNWTFISYSEVSKNESLKLIRDTLLEYLHEHSDELSHILEWEEREDANGIKYKQPIQKVITDETLSKLIQEINDAYDIAPFFNKNVKKYPWAKPF